MAARRAGKKISEPLAEERVWKEEPELIRRFLDERLRYEQLCAEVAYILEKGLRESGIEFASVTRRAKTLKSFLEKLGRKTYKEPFNEVTDFAGVRVVCLYRADLPKIEELVRREFEVEEKVDKYEEQGTDRFGYGAVHFIMSLGARSSGARYDDLKDLRCELQTRTVLQDAWAIIDHHLVYKQVPALPSSLRRRLNSLVGLFETADDQFDALRRQREDYVDEVEDRRTHDDFLAQEVNYDTLKAYCKSMIPDLEVDDGYLGGTLQLLGKTNKFRTLADVDAAHELYKEAIQRDREDKISGFPYTDACDVIDMAFMLADPDYYYGDPRGQAERLRKELDLKG